MREETKEVKVIKKVDFISEVLNQDSKLNEFLGKNEVVDHSLVQRKLIVLNLPALSIMLMSHPVHEEDNRIFQGRILPLYLTLSKDASEEVRAHCASIFSEVSHEFLMCYRW